MRSLAPLLLLFQLYAQSQPPSPTPRESKKTPQGKAHSKQSKAPTNQQLSDNLTAIQQKLDSEIAAREKLEKAAQHESKTSPEGWLKWSTIVTAAATFFIAILAVFQWLVIRKQAKDMEEGLAETRKAADAAKKSADALIGSERSWLIPDNFETNEAAHFMRFKNCGRTPAHVKEIRCAYVGALARDVWPVDYTAVHELVCPSKPIAPGELTDTYSVGLVLEPDPGRKTKHVFGIVRYTDIGEDERTITFYLTLVPNPPKWVKSGPPGANRYT